jgi:hypothetical protein
MAIFVAASTCGASRFPLLPDALHDIRIALSRETELSRKQFVLVGVSIDQDASTGVEFLRRYGPFDEVLAGHGWLNAGAIAYVVRDMPSEHSIPQLVLVERDLDVEDGRIVDVHDTLVGRKIGADQIVSYAAFLKNNAPSSLSRSGRQGGVAHE